MAQGVATQSVAHIEVLGLAHEFVHGRIGRFISALLVGEHGINRDTAVRTDHPVGKFSIVDEFDHVGPRHLQDVRRLKCCEFGIHPASGDQISNERLEVGNVAVTLVNEGC